MQVYEQNRILIKDLKKYFLGISKGDNHRGAILEATSALKSVKSAIFLILCTAVTYCY